MKIYKDLLNYIYQGLDVNLLAYTTNLELLQKQLEEKLSEQISKDEINILYYSNVYHLKLNEPFYGLGRNHLIFDIITKIKHGDKSNIIFVLKENLQTYKITNKFYMIGNCLKKTAITIFDQTNNVNSTFSGLGFKLTYPIQLNLIFKMDMEDKEIIFNELINLSQNYDLNYINESTMQIVHKKKVYESSVTNINSLLSLQENPELILQSDVQKKKTMLQKEIEILSEENSSENAEQDLFTIFNNSKKEKTKIKI